MENLLELKQIWLKKDKLQLENKQALSDAMEKMAKVESELDGFVISN